MSILTIYYSVLFSCHCFKTRQQRPEQGGKRHRHFEDLLSEPRSKWLRRDWRCQPWRSWNRIFFQPQSLDWDEHEIHIILYINKHSDIFKCQDLTCGYRTSQGSIMLCWGGFHIHTVPIWILLDQKDNSEVGRNLDSFSRLPQTNKQFT